MSLGPGTRLGAYEIIALVGAGGMGEVYRARDPRLKREVAIKILPNAFADDADRLTRFQREAELLAALNHPNIAQIYGIEDRALVLELVDGPTLADRIAQGPVPLVEALPIAKQIADALEAAHEQGIIHRDLKPANIKVKADGTVKVLDFGLAKASQASDPGHQASGLTHSPTITTPALATHAGVILGTAAYMSPEQAKGRPLDRRTDMWAFGCVLFEMLTGTRAFGGEDVSDTLAEIIKGEPEWAALPAKTPAVIAKLLRRCLTKDRKSRLSDAAVARLEIDEALAGPAETSVPLVVAAQSRRERLGWALLSVALLVSAAMATLVWVRTDGPVVRPYRVSVLPPPGMRTGIFRGFGSNRPLSVLAVSPDGRYLAFLATGDDARTSLWLRQLDSLTARELPGTDGAVGAFWKPDSRTIGFFADGKLKTIELTGGTPVTLCDAPANATGTWGRQGDILFGTLSLREPIRRVPSSGGTATPVTTLQDQSLLDRHGWPFFLPDGRSFLYLVAAGPGGLPTMKAQGVFAASLDSPETKQILPAGSNVEYAGGSLFFLRENVLVAQPFNPDRLELSGEPVLVAQDISIGTSGLEAGIAGTFSVSEAGVLAYQTRSAEVRSRLLWLDRAGRTLGELGQIAGYTEPELSPDDKRVAVSVLDPVKRNRDIWLYDAKNGAAQRLTLDMPDSLSPRWSSDGAQVFFSSVVRGNRDIYRKASTGAGPESRVVADAAEKHLSDVSQDGKHVIYQSAFGGRGSNLFVRPVAGDAKPTPFAASKSSAFWGRFSPDGRWVVYYSDASGRREVWVARFPDDGSKWQISTTGGMFPRWRRDGKELFYLGSDDKLYAVPVKGDGPAFEFGAPVPLFPTRPQGPFSSYAVSSDGQRFLVNSRLEEDTVTPITLLVNWSAGLTSRN